MTSPLSSSSSPSRTRSSVLLPAPLRPMKPTLTLSLKRGLGVVEQHLIAVALAGFRDL